MVKCSGFDDADLSNRRFLYTFTKVIDFSIYNLITILYKSVFGFKLILTY